MKRKASYWLIRAAPSGVNLGNMVGSIGHPFSSMMANVDRESFAMARQLLAKIPYGVLSGISILKVS